ncbi:MAG: diacylglycerol kinase family protein [Oscillospiraceae bacterium]|nr:diacylglycerol kinase family protein [Oscillospiraceae bacterium]
MRKYILYNPLAGDEKGKENAKKLDALYIGHELIYRDLTEIDDWKDFFTFLSPEDEIIVCGGDGTLSRFVNSIDGIEIQNNILYYAIGSGNDFLHDLNKPNGSEPFCINEYIDNLPYIYLDGVRRRFINGIGYGLDGFVCKLGNERRKKTGKKVNYTTTALRALLFLYKTRSATVIIDGHEKHYDRVWLTPTMKGRFFGGGMMIAPGQNRGSSDLTVLVAHGCGRLRLLTIFPSIFKGEHIKYKKVIEVFTAKEVTIIYDEPCAMQIDGETVTGVKEYTASVYTKITV